MIFTVNSEELGRNIQGLAKMMSGKNSLAILDHFLFQIDGDDLHVIASDSENMMRTTMNILSATLLNDESKSFCIHNTVICDFLKNIPEQPIQFEVDLAACVVQLSYMNGHINFPCIAGEDFPSFNVVGEDAETVMLPSTYILDDICKTSPFVGQESLRPSMMAICFQFKQDGLDVVSTNGNVLVKITHSDVTKENEATMLLPQKPVSLLKYFLNKEDKAVTIKFTDNTAVFSSENWKLTCRLIEGKYPNYNSVIPKSHSLEVVVDKKPLQESIRRILPMGNQTMKTIIVNVVDTFLELFSENIDFCTSAKEHIACETIGDGLRIGLNGEKLYEVLSQTPSETVRMEMTEPMRPIIVSPKEDRKDVTFLALLMPCMLD